MSKQCTVCQRELGIMDGKYVLKDKVIVCKKCLKIPMSMLANLKNMSLEQVKESLADNSDREQENKTFEYTKKVKSYLQINTDTKKFRVPSSKLIKKNLAIINFNELVSYEVIEDGEQLSSGGLGRAAVGGVLFGGVGAIVGGITGGKKTKSTCDKLFIKLTLDSIDNPVLYIKFIELSMKKKNFMYKEALKAAEECTSLLELILRDNENNKNTNVEPVNSNGSLDELQKLKELLDIGVINQDDYDAKKKQILGI